MDCVPKKKDLLDFTSLRSNVKSLLSQLFLIVVLIAFLVVAYLITRNEQLLTIIHMLVVAFLMKLGVPLPTSPTN